MKVRAGGRAGIADLADDVTLLHREIVRAKKDIDCKGALVILLLQHSGSNITAERQQMAVDRHRTVGMGDVYAIAVACRRDADAAHISIFYRMYRIAYLAAGAEVDAAVEMVVPQLAVGAGE